MAPCQTFFTPLFKCHLFCEVFLGHLFRFVMSLLPQLPIHFPWSVFLPCLISFCHTRLYLLIWLIIYLPPLECELYEDGCCLFIFLLCTLVNLQCLEWCLAQCKVSINMGIREWRNQWMKITHISPPKDNTAKDWLYSLPDFLLLSLVLTELSRSPVITERERDSSLKICLHLWWPWWRSGPHHGRPRNQCF